MNKAKGKIAVALAVAVAVAVALALALAVALALSLSLSLALSLSLTPSLRLADTAFQTLGLNQLVLAVPRGQSSCIPPPQGPWIHRV